MTQLSPPPISTQRTTMRAAVVTAPGHVEVRSAPIPRPGPTDIRVRIAGCGVCASNIPPFEGREWFKYPLSPGQLGHEAWGVVDAIGPDVMHFAPGDSIAFLSDHAYAEYDLTTEDKAIHLPNEVVGHPFPAEPLGCAVNIFKRSKIKAGDTVVIVGIGFLGALLTRLASDANARVIALAHRATAQHFAHLMGAPHVIPMDDHYKIIDEVRQLTGGRFADIVIECTGKQWPLDLSAELTREYGRLVIAGYHQDGPRQVNMQLWNWRGLDVINAHERDPAIYLAGMNEAARLIAAGSLDPAPLYTHTYPLEKLADALTATRDRPEGFMKALIKI